MVILGIFGLLVLLIALDALLTSRYRRPPENSPFKDTVAGRALFDRSGGGAD